MPGWVIGGLIGLLFLMAGLVTAALPQDKHTIKGTELDPPRLLHLTRPDGEPEVVVREAVVSFTKSFIGPIAGHTTTVKTLYGDLDVRETVEQIEEQWG